MVLKWSQAVFDNDESPFIVSGNTSECFQFQSGWQWGQTKWRAIAVSSCQPFNNWALLFCPHMLKGMQILPQLVLLSPLSEFLLLPLPPLLPPSTIRYDVSTLSPDFFFHFFFIPPVSAPPFFLLLSTQALLSLLCLLSPTFSFSLFWSARLLMSLKSL